MNLKLLSIKFKFYSLILKDPRRKNIFRIAFEYLKFRITNKDIAHQYFGKFFYRKGFKDFTRYLLPDALERKCWDLNNPVYLSILNDKYLFEQFFSQFNLPVIQSILYNRNSLFFMKGKMRQINSVTEFMDMLKSLLDEGHFRQGIFIKKTDSSYGGADIFKVNRVDLVKNHPELKKIYHTVISSGFLFQEVLLQHEKLNEINSYCLNTIRIDTYTDLLNVAKILSGFMRIGINKMYVDNVSSGGVFVGIDLKNGTLLSEAISDIQFGQGMSYTTHPITGFRFEGFQIPFFREVKSLVLEAASYVPQLKIVGWDVAITPDGPVLVEGNGRPGLTYSEIAQKGFYNNQVFFELKSASI